MRALAQRASVARLRRENQAAQDQKSIERFVSRHLSPSDARPGSARVDACS